MRSWSLWGLLLVLGLAVPAVASACPFAEQARVEAGLSPFATPKVSLAIAQDRLGLLIDSTVSGCPGQILLHQREVARAVDEGLAGTRVDGAFAVPGLEYDLTATTTGVSLRVAGPADVLAIFRAILEEEQAQKAAHAQAPFKGSCKGCHGAAKDAIY